MGSIILVLIIIASIAVGLFFLVKKKLKEIDESMTGAVSDGAAITNSQDYIPFDEISNDMISLGDHQYRAILEISSTNFGLKTEKEKAVIESSFQRVLNSLQFPITIFVQTKVIDDSKMLERLDEELMETINEHPEFEQYAIAYSQGMHTLHERIGNNKQKKKYIIVPYDEAKELTDLNDHEKYEEAKKELMLRASMIMDNMQSMGLKATLLESDQLLELFYSIFHKDDYRNVEHVISGEFLQLIVSGGGASLLRDMKNDDKVDVMLYEMQRRLRDEVLSKTLSETERKLYTAFFGEMANMRTGLKEFQKEEKMRPFIEAVKEEQESAKRSGGGR